MVSYFPVRTRAGTFVPVRRNRLIRHKAHGAGLLLAPGLGATEAPLDVTLQKGQGVKKQALTNVIDRLEELRNKAVKTKKKTIRLG